MNLKSWTGVAVFCGSIGFAACCSAATLPAPVSQKNASLQEFSASIQGLTDRVSRSVVQLVATGYGFTESENQSGSIALVRQRATGSGVIVSTDGYIMTNAHVVDSARHIAVRLDVGSERTVSLEGKLVGLDRTLDLALVKVDAGGLQPLQFTDSDLLKQGQLVLAFGAPLGLDNSVSMGVISSVARQISSDDPRIYVQTDAPINPGNSGGPLVDVNGKIAGIDTFIFSRSGGSEGLGFAIPSNVVAYAYNQLKADGHVHHGQLGIALRTITEPLAEGLALQPYSGALVEDINPNGSAAESGLTIGDVIVSIGSRLVHNSRDFSLGIYRYSIGEFADVKVLRGNNIEAFRIKVTEAEGDPARLADLVDPVKNGIPQLGILGMELNGDVRKLLGSEVRMDSGVLVASTTGTSTYLGDELVQGDIIHSINSRPIDTFDELRTAIGKAEPGASLVLQVERDGRLLFLVLESN